MSPKDCLDSKLRSTFRVRFSFRFNAKVVCTLRKLVVRVPFRLQIARKPTFDTAHEIIWRETFSEETRAHPTFSN